MPYKCSGIAKIKNPGLSKREYARDWSLKKKYGISLEDFNVMFKEQEKKCKICNKEMELPTIGQGQGLDIVAVDHCHTTGYVRGLLCNACNKGIGLLKDDVAILEKAIKYLKDGKDEEVSNSKGSEEVIPN